MIDIRPAFLASFLPQLRDKFQPSFTPPFSRQDSIALSPLTQPIFGKHPDAFGGRKFLILNPPGASRDWTYSGRALSRTG
jgi:hypothetical protein